MSIWWCKRGQVELLREIEAGRHNGILRVPEQIILVVRELQQTRCRRVGGVVPARHLHAKQSIDFTDDQRAIQLERILQ